MNRIDRSVRLTVACFCYFVKLPTEAMCDIYINKDSCYGPVSIEA